MIQEKQRVGTKGRDQGSDAYQVFSPPRVFIYQSTWFKKVAGSLPLISLFNIPPNISDMNKQVDYQVKTSTIHKGYIMEQIYLFYYLSMSDIAYYHGSNLFNF
jgi:hypothetical protein